MPKLFTHTNNGQPATGNSGVVDFCITFGMLCSNPVMINSLNEPVRDIAILKYADDYYVKKHPGHDDIYLVIEVSDTTLAYDKEIKLPLYASAGIRELWIINIEKNEIEVHRSPATDVYKTISINRSGDKISLQAFDLSFDAGVLLGI
jgi:Uma2 family endonuclease